MARKSRAYHYHVFAVAPLVMIADLAARNGADLYGAENGALARLVTRVLSSFADDAFFVQATGYEQDRIGSSKAPHFAWLEAYYARTRDAQAAPFIAKLRPMKERRLGGDMTLLYGATLN
jgi:poly(beta-D-mannuronate) lyase